MHDPSTQAFRICWPWFRTTKLKTLSFRSWVPAITVWHHDPERKGDDDSCGWFIRTRHCDKEKLQKIRKRFEDDWDRTWTSTPEEPGETARTYFRGYFCPNGDPHMSVPGIILNLVFLAAFEHFGNRKKAIKFCQSTLAEIMLFAENPTDSLFDTVTRTFADGEPYSERRRNERLDELTGIIYSWILRSLRPWYRHPRWHIHHWQLQIHAWQWLKRGLLDRCCKCGKGFAFGSSCIGDWDGTKIWHDRCDGPHPDQAQKVSPIAE